MWAVEGGPTVCVEACEAGVGNGGPVPAMLKFSSDTAVLGHVTRRALSDVVHRMLRGGNTLGSFDERVASHLLECV